jgi:hypothetical protein
MFMCVSVDLITVPLTDLMSSCVKGMEGMQVAGSILVGR